MVCVSAGASEKDGAAEGDGVGTSSYTGFTAPKVLVPGSAPPRNAGPTGSVGPASVKAPSGRTWIQMPVLPLRNTRVGSWSEFPVASSSPAKTRSTPPRALPYRMSPGWSGTPRA
eukprot:scaffold2424_cov134-Pinguiococcus_pyrenoidosus.AAC.1